MTLASLTASIPNTLPGRLQDLARSRPAAVAIRHKVRGIWLPRTWQRLAAEVAHLADALAARGFAKGEVVVVRSDLRPEAIVVTLAAEWLGGAALWIESPDAARSWATGAPSGSRVHPRFAFAKEEEELVALGAVLNLQAPFVFGLHASTRGLSRGLDPTLLAYEEVIPDALADLAGPEMIAASDEPALFFDGKDRATHAELIAAARSWLDAEHIDDRNDALASERSPSSQIRFILAAWLVAGFRLNCHEHASTANYDRRELGPSLFAATSDTYAELHRQILESFPPLGSLSRKVVDWGLAKEGGVLWVSLGEWFLRRPLRDVIGFSRVKTALVLGEMPDDAVADLFAQLGTRLRGVALHSHDNPRDDPRATVEDGHTPSTGLVGIASIFEPPVDLAASPRAGAR
jgi:hypothetical protein